MVDYVIFSRYSTVGELGRSIPSPPTGFGDLDSDTEPFSGTASREGETSLSIQDEGAELVYRLHFQGACEAD